MAEGFVCPKCGVVDEPFHIASRGLYQCKHCSHQASVTAGTVMEKTRIPLLKWFLAMILMSSDKRGCSALQISKELGLCYSSAWFLCHRIRSAMGERDSEYVLSGHIEADDAFFGAPTSNGKRSRGTDKTVVLVGLSCDPVNDPEHLKWLHVVISNAKTFINGTFHGLGERHLQSYLDEFCYRFNRRRFTLQHFNRTLFACARASRLSYAELTR